ncbi:MAG TPA: hypothetical protein VG013_16315 [Gemmataceae bacterium]|jgi:hypothetical protein|nr:hypothetical protein [Gemmataceae bacterium]
MFRLLLATATCLGLGMALVAAPLPEGAVTFIDLQPKANQKLSEPFHDNKEGNHLESLPTGEQKFAGVKFKVGASMIQLGSKVVKMPDKVEGIKVNKKFARLHLLHATGYGGGPNTEGSVGYVADDTVIGKYIIHYEDKSKETIEIVYGKDVRDWWFTGEEKATSRSKVAWEGENEVSKAANAKIRLYLTTWKNPKPGKKVVSIDYLSTKTTAAAPFCVAMTIEKR